MTANINGITIQYSAQGNADGLPIVFVHGFPFSSEMWNSQLAVLPRNFRAIAYDIRGLGSSGVGDGQYTIDLFVDDLTVLLDHLNISKTILCGLSMGGYISQRMMQLHPDRIAGLVLCNTKSEADTNEAKANRANVIRRVKQYGVTDFTEGFLKQIFSEQTFVSRQQAVALIRTIIKQTSTLGLCGNQLALSARLDTTPVLAGIHVPALLMAGAHDPFAPVAVMRAMHEKIEGSEFHILPNSAHMSNIEDTDEFNEHLLAFLKRHWQH